MGDETPRPRQVESPERGYGSVVRQAAAILTVLAALVGVPATSAAGHVGVSPLASVDVKGSGPLIWGRVAVRVAPSRSAKVITTLAQFRPDFHPRTVMALSARLGAIR